METSLPTNWLNYVSWGEVDTVPSVTYVGGTESIGNTIVVSDDWTGTNCYPYYSYYPWWPSIQKVRLTMSDVEKLRAAAKKDNALKKVLEKIGPHIEVEVDF